MVMVLFAENYPLQIDIVKMIHLSLNMGWREWRCCCERQDRNINRGNATRRWRVDNPRSHRATAAATAANSARIRQRPAISVIIIERHKRQRRSRSEHRHRFDTCSYNSNRRSWPAVRSRMAFLSSSSLRVKVRIIGKIKRFECTD